MNQLMHFILIIGLFISIVGLFPTQAAHAAQIFTVTKIKANDTFTSHGDFIGGEAYAVPGRLAPADFNGDGRTDVSVFRPSNGVWYVKDQFGVQFGANGDIPVAGDYNGDGRTDVAVFRPSNGVWYVKDQFSVQFGADGDIPVPGDYDGDGDTDVAIFRPTNGVWYVKDQFGVQFGASGDIPVAGDYNGDGRTAVAVFRPSNGVWYVKDQFSVQWGANGDIPVPGDYNGGGRIDVAVFRPSNGVWYVKDQFNVQWGANGDSPVPGDYDGDGDGDVAVFRPSNGIWNVKNQFSVGFGMNGDIPLPARPFRVITLIVPDGYRTVQAAIHAASPGDTILVRPGTYIENLTLNKSVTLTALFFNPDDPTQNTTIIDGRSSNPTITIPVGVSPMPTIRGFVLRNGIDGIRTASEVIIEDNYFVSSTDQIDYTSGGGGINRHNVYFDSRDDAIDLDNMNRPLLIENNRMMYNRDDGIEVRLQDATAPAKPVTITIRNNEIIGCYEDGIQFIDYSQPLDSNRSFVVSNNLIANCRFAGIGLMPNGISNENYSGANIVESIHVYNNTFYGNDYGISGGDKLVAINNIIANSTTKGVWRVQGPAGVNSSVVAYTLFHNNGIDTDQSTLGVGNLFGQNPLFASLPNPGPDGVWSSVDDDFSGLVLLSASPAIDAGDNATCPSTDLRGASRPQDGNHDGRAICDMGAYEFVVATIAAVFHPSNGVWYVKGQFGVQFGAPGDIPVPGDYDGDGNTDVAVFRPSNGVWYVKDQFGAQFGANGDIPVPGDYNGDSDADVAVFRPWNGVWYVKDQFGVQFGANGDIPVPARP